MTHRPESTPLRFFIGFDPDEAMAYHALCQSILEKATIPVTFCPLRTDTLRGFFDRPRDPKQSNEFSFTRFLVPHLAGYVGHAIYMDCDMLLRVDASALLDVIHAAPDHAALVAKHDYIPKSKRKYLNNVQYSYPKKNWSSFVIWNCAHEKNRTLSPEFVAGASGLELHRFTWLDEGDIGGLDLEWNWLVDEYEAGNDAVKIVHWTNGGPYFEEFKEVEFAQEWFETAARLTHVRTL